MKKQKSQKKTSDALKIIDRRFFRDDAEMQHMVQEEFEKLQIGQQIYDLRKEANLTQKQLADLIGTTGSVISRLEHADYDGHSLKMLQKIALALGKRIQLKIVDREAS